jgi:pimeloyl-ACP methyl ester carboxylesterase
MTHHVIYVPGLGDAKAQGQELVTKLWRPLGVQGHYVPLRWAVDEPWKLKLQHLLDAIDALSKTGTVSLVGTSAGASAVLQAYALRKDKVAGVVCICGKINHPETVNPRYYTENPAFKDALAQLQAALPGLSAADRDHILSIHPLWDGTVSPADTILPGAHERTLLTVGHPFSIFCALTFGAPGMMRFLKRQAQQFR